jgi:hypothetical protein
MFRSWLRIVSHLQHCGVTERVNIISVYPPLGFVAVCSSSEFWVVFIRLRVVSWEERMGEVICSTVTSVGCLAILLLEFADKVSRPVICSDWLTKPYFITNPINFSFLALTLTTIIKQRTIIQHSNLPHQKISRLPRVDDVLFIIQQLLFKIFRELLAYHPTAQHQPQSAHKPYGPSFTGFKTTLRNVQISGLL